MHAVLSDADSAAHSCGDLDGEFEPSANPLQRRGRVKSYMRKKTAKNVSSNQSQSIRKGEVFLCFTLKSGHHFSLGLLPKPSGVQGS